MPNERMSAQNDSIGRGSPAPVELVPNHAVAVLLESKALLRGVLCSVSRRLSF